MKLTDETALRRRLHEEIDVTEVGPAPLAAVFRQSRVVRSRRIAVLSGVATIAAVLGLLATSADSGPAWPHRHPGVVKGSRTDKRHGQAELTTGPVDALAVSGSVLYVATGDYPATLAAYSRATGHLVGQISVPASPSAVRIGPSGLVWLAFYPDQNGGGTGVWLLSPDLSRRSALNLGVARYHGAAPFDVLATGSHSALLATDHGLATVRLPAPGGGGQAALTWASPSFIPSMRRFGLPEWLGMVAGKTAVRQQHDGAVNSTLTFAGHARPVSHVLIGSMAGQGAGLWGITTGQTQALIRLSSQLRRATPRSLRENPLLADPVRVQTYGAVVWVIRSERPYIACFTYRGRAGPIATIGTRLQPTELAATTSAVYVADSVGVTRYGVPVACR